MEVKTAKTAGFCFGVQRALEQVYRAIRQGRQPIYTFGPIIHNEQVVEELAGQGVRIIEGTEELQALQEGTVVIRSHGVPRSIYRLIEEKGLELVDATCPFVRKIHRIVDEHSRNGEEILIIGNSGHPEVEGIKGWCSGAVSVIGTEEEARSFVENRAAGQPLCIVSQTTFNYKNFNKLVEILENLSYYNTVHILNTICSATEERQSEARSIARTVDAMIVIGGSHSSNTRKLFEICRKECENTYYIQTLRDLEVRRLPSVGCVGITAGASTPKKIIEEVSKQMEDLSFEQMLEDSFKTIHNGEIVEGTVIDVKEDEIVLNIGYKMDGIITRNEYTNDSSADLRDLVHVNDKLEAKVMKVNDGDGQVVLTYKRLAAEKGNKRLEEAFNNHEVLTAPVVQVLGGGLSVVVDEARVFIPASLVSDTYEKNLEKYNGQEIEFVITEFNPRRRRIIGDRKQLLVARKAEMQKALFERIHVGDVVTGTVKNVTDFGAFVDLGGADGLLHISEMSWGHVDNPRKHFKNGDELEVLIKDISGDKIALSRKFEDQNPWLTASEKYAAGTVVEGRVARMTDFGAFIELEPGVDALLHVSQISHNHVDKPSDILSVNEMITAKVVDFNGEGRKISLSMKALENNAPAPAYEETEE